MPLYEYRCSCGQTQEHFVAFAQRYATHPCPCGGKADYVFPLHLTFQDFQPYYDESLNCDIKGRRHKREVLRLLGVQEAGDPVKGARNFDRHAPYHVQPLAPRGIEPESPELRRAQADQDWQVEVQQGDTWKPVKF